MGDPGATVEALALSAPDADARERLERVGEIPPKNKVVGARRQHDLGDVERASMLVPVFLGMSTTGAGTHLHHVPAGAGTNAVSALIATGLHAVSYLTVTACIALLVFEKVGVGILRRAWVDLDLIWAVALLMTGVVTLMI